MSHTNNSDGTRRPAHTSLIVACTGCGTEIEDDWDYCYECGADACPEDTVLVPLREFKHDRWEANR